MNNLPEIGARVRYTGTTPWAYHVATGEGVTGTVVGHVPVYRNDVETVRVPRPKDEWHVQVAIDRRPQNWARDSLRFTPKVAHIERVD